jgi:hypothetical protein
MVLDRDETWIDTDDLRIMTCRLTCGYADGFDMVMVRSSSHSPSRRKGEPRRGWLARCTLVGPPYC